MYVHIQIVHDVCLTQKYNPVVLRHYIHLHKNFPFVPLPEVFNTLRTGDADLRFYITTVQDG